MKYLNNHKLLILNSPYLKHSKSNKIKLISKSVNHNFKIPIKFNFNQMSDKIILPIISKFKQRTKVSKKTLSKNFSNMKSNSNKKILLRSYKSSSIKCESLSNSLKNKTQLKLLKML